MRKLCKRNVQFDNSIEAYARTCYCACSCRCFCMFIFNSASSLNNGHTNLGHSGRDTVNLRR